MITARKRTVLPSSAFMPCGSLELKYILSPWLRMISLPSMLISIRPSSDKVEFLSVMIGYNGSARSFALGSTVTMNGSAVRFMNPEASDWYL